MVDRRCVLVIGGAGGVGSGIVEALLERNEFDCVLASSRNAAKLDMLRSRMNHEPRLIGIVGTIDNRATADTLLAEARAYGRLGAVAACLGGWWDGPLLTEMDETEWDRTLERLPRPHFIVARVFVPALIATSARYLLIGGDAALGPVPYSTLVSIAGAAQIMLTRALVAERQNMPFQIPGPLRPET